MELVFSAFFVDRDSRLMEGRPRWAMANEFQPGTSCQGELKVSPLYIVIDPVNYGILNVTLPPGCTAAAGYSLGVDVPQGAPIATSVSGAQVTVTVPYEPPPGTWLTYNIRVYVKKGGVEYTYMPSGSTVPKKLEAFADASVHPSPQTVEISVTPGAGSGVEQVFTFKRPYHWMFGSQQMQHILFDPAKDTAPASAVNRCYMVVLSQSNAVALFNDDTSASSMFLMGNGAPSSGTETIANGQCQLYQKDSMGYVSASAPDNHYEWKYKIVFNPARFGGDKTIWTRENDNWDAPATSGMKRIGSWVVVGAQ